jgi:tyrosine-protein kinase Etk/Wzc
MQELEISEQASDSKVMANGTATSSIEQLLLQYFALAIRRRRFILISTIAAGVLSVLYSLILPVWYSSSATIMISNSSDLLGLSKLLGGSGFGDILGKGKNADDIDKYEAIFKSYRLRMDLVNKYDLIKQYEHDDKNDKEPIKHTLDDLSKNISFKDNKDGTITITAFYKEDSIKAAEMVNFIVQSIDKINRELTTEAARSNRIFIEDRYYKAMADLKSAEDSLNAFQHKNGVVEVNNQIKASLEAGAQLEVTAMQTEVEYKSLLKNLSPSHPEVIQARAKLDELKNQLQKFNKGGLVSDLIIPLAKMPDVGMAYLRLYRTILLQTKIVEFLVPQYEQAKIQEAKDTPTMLVLDKGQVPEWKSKPKRAFVVLGITLAVFFFSIAFVLLNEQVQKGTYQQWIQLLKAAVRFR